MKKLVFMFAIAQLANSSFASEAPALAAEDMHALFGTEAAPKDEHAQLDAALSSRVAKPASPKAAAAQPAVSGWFSWVPSLWSSAPVVQPAAPVSPKALTAASALAAITDSK